MGRSVERQNKAAYYTEKVKTIAANDAIFSDDPEALTKLKEKHAALTKLQDFMKAADRCIRKHD